jgi:hypothetical protein
MTKIESEKIYKFNLITYLHPGLDDMIICGFYSNENSPIWLVCVDKNRTHHDGMYSMGNIIYHPRYKPKYTKLIAKVWNTNIIAGDDYFIKVYNDENLIFYD